MALALLNSSVIPLHICCANSLISADSPPTVVLPPVAAAAPPTIVCRSNISSAPSGPYLNSQSTYNASSFCVRIVYPFINNNSD